jgi:tRNA(Ile2) C34 agmatinyltransferase TiaS
VKEQLVLPIATAPVGTRCGYCGGPLTRRAGGDFRCVPCGPELAKVRTVADWRAFARRAAARGGLR